MARKSSTTDNTSTEAQAPVEPTEATEGTAPAVEGTEATEAPKEETPIDLTAFNEAVASAVAEKDESTGVVPEANLAEVTKQYRALDGVKPKNKAKAAVDELMLAAVDAMDAQLARAYSMVQQNLTAGSGAKKESTPADPTAAFVARVAALQIAYGLVTQSVPENVGADWQEKVTAAVAEAQEGVQAMQAHLTKEVPEGEERGDAPEVSPIVRSAFKLAQGKASGGGRVSGGSGVRRDVGKHITEAFAEHPSGHVLKVSEIANFKSTEYGDDKPSQGAVSARLFPTSGKCTVEGIEPIAKDADGPNRARKL